MIIEMIEDDHWLLVTLVTKSQPIIQQHDTLHDM